MVVGQQGCAYRKDESEREKDGGAARCVILLRSDEGDERADDQSGDQTANVGGVVGGADDGSEDQIVDDEHRKAAQGAGERGARD